MIVLRRNTSYPHTFRELLYFAYVGPILQNKVDTYCNITKSRT